MTVRRAAAWCGLILAAAAGALGGVALGIPAPWLIAPLLVAIVAAVTGLVDLRVPGRVFTGAQVAVGMLIAQTFTPGVVASIARSWPAMVLVVGTTIAAAAAAGWVLARFSSLPPATAAWGSAPGGASAMTAMSADYGADARVVAFMQYLRLTLVVLTAGTTARLLLPAGAHPRVLAAPTVAPGAFALTLAVGAVGALLALRVRLPAGALLGPMVVGAALQGAGVMHVALPAPFVDASYLTLGLAIGLLYTRATVRYVLRVLPQLLAATALLLALCGASAALLTATIHVDALTAYLATTPGGLDSVAVIALGSGANVPLILATQALRVFVVVLTGPPLARLIARAA